MRHPLYPALKPAPAAEARSLSTALAGTYDELVRAASVGAQVARAVFPVHDPSDPFPSEDQREALWDMFKVPVLAMLVDNRGSVIGYECETQEGFHLNEEFAGDVSFGRVESSLCECGRHGRRLMPAEDAFLPEPVSLASAAD
jgi:hypothetical protein